MIQRYWIAISSIRTAHGHEYNEKNTYVNSKGSRQCRACNREKETFRRNKLKNLESL